METVKETKKVRTPKVIILYNNKDITKNINKYIESVTYTDYEKDQSDELSITLNDFDALFQNEWWFSKGGKISAQIGYENERLLNCGTFTVDEPELQITTEGDKVTVRALAASINQKIREKNARSFVNKTLIQIAKSIAKNHGYTVAGSAGFIKIPYAAQYNETDLCFLRRLAESHGYIFKLTDTVITFVPVENLESSKTLLAVTRKNVDNVVLRDTATKTYTACSVKYLNPKTGKLVSYTAKSKAKGVKTETLKLDIKCASKAQAKVAASAGLKRGSKAINGNIDFSSGQINAIAGVNIIAKFNTKLDGKYHITQSTHTVTQDDYKTSAEVEKIA